MKTTNNERGKEVTKRAGAMALACLILLAAGAAEGQPAWKKIAEKLRPNSLDKRASAAPVAVRDESVPERPEGPPGLVDSSVAMVKIGKSEEDFEFNPSGETVGLPSLDGSGKGGRSQINLGKEYEETGNVMNVFDDPGVRRLLGDNPRFIYDPDARPDPMIFPPVRNAAIYAELSVKAEKLLEKEDYAGAIQAYTDVLELKDRRFIIEMKDKILQAQQALGASMAQDEPVETVVAELPIWIRENTNGVLYDVEGSLCLVGDFMLAKGEVVPSHPGVTIEVIEKERVVFAIAGESFEVSVKGYED